MGIDLAVTTLWAELATWSPTAMEIILRPEYWAVHGATRMGKALGFEDRRADDALEPAALAEGVARAEALMALLVRADREARAWTEPAPPSQATTGAEVRGALEGQHIADVDPGALERLFDIAHALQAAPTALPKDASLERVRALLATPPRIAPRPSGPGSSLLASSTNTLWVPVPLASAWDGPAGVIASAVQLADDLDALPSCLAELDAGVGQLLRDLTRALASAPHGASLSLGG